jgi:hypothetical protein
MGETVSEDTPYQQSDAPLIAVLALLLIHLHAGVLT